MLPTRWICVLTLGLATGLALSAPKPAAAQVSPADSAAVLYHAATQLEAQGRSDAADALYRFILRRFPGTPAALEVERLLGQRAARPDESGRVELIVWSTLYGLWLGVAVPGAFGADDPEPYGLGLLVGGPAGFFISKSYADRTPIGVGDARAITWGGMWGTWQGFGWREVFELGSKTQRFCDIEGRNCVENEQESAEAVFTAMVVGGLAGLTTGAVLARTREIAPGTGTLVSLGSLWGTWYGTAAGVLADAEGDALLTAALVGGNAGLVSMALLAPGWNMSRERARLISIAGVAGLVAGFGIDLLAQVDDDKVGIGIPAATSIVGLAIGANWTRNYDAERRGQPLPPGEPESAASHSGRAGAVHAPGSEPYPGAALLQLRDGRAAFDLPLPGPTLLPADAQGQRRVPALRFTLLDARF